MRGGEKEIEEKERRKTVRESHTCTKIVRVKERGEVRCE